MNFCDAERMFIVHGVEANFRVDGRQRAEYRPMELETNLIEHAFGSARVRLASTDVLVAVKVEIEIPSVDEPNEGKLEFFVDCSANATPAFEGRGGDELATEIANSLNTAFRSARALDLTRLSVKAALYDTRIPKINEIKLDGDNIELEISENEAEYEKLDVTNVPIIVMDPSNQEEECSVCAMLVAISASKLTCAFKVGFGSFRAKTLMNGLALGKDAGVELDRTLMEALKKEDNLNKTEYIGFLK
ncbi:Rrp42 [Carabus blaptoides fortunei]